MLHFPLLLPLITVALIRQDFCHPATHEHKWKLPSGQEAFPRSLSPSTIARAKDVLGALCHDHLASADASSYASLLGGVFLILMLLLVRLLGSCNCSLPCCLAASSMAVEGLLWQDPSHGIPINEEPILEISGSHRQAVVISPLPLFHFKPLLSTSWNMGPWVSQGII